MRDDLGLETLLDLNGSIIDQGNGYWIGFKNAYQLLEDFFREVDRVLQELKQP